MGWFWGSSNDKASNLSSEDPLRNLDPTLRDFLAKESPVKYSSSSPRIEALAVTSHISHPEQQPALKKHSSEKGTETIPKAPPPTLYEDGRYAHLWSTYRPLGEIENEFKSDAEKLNDVLDGYKHRKAQIGRAAVENCAMEQWAVDECFRLGGIKSKMTMCRAENRKFNRCYTVQAKFLKALGYLAAYDRPAEVDERIQMHADKLFHRMLDQEDAIEAAKAEGRPVPTFPSLVTAPIAPASGTGRTEAKDLSEDLQRRLKRRLDEVQPEVREVEEKAIKAELEAGEQIGGELNKIYDKIEKERAIRKEQGRETMMDRYISIFRLRR